MLPCVTFLTVYVIIKNKPRVSPCVILNLIRMIIRIATFVLHLVMCPYLSATHYAMPFPLCYTLYFFHKRMLHVMLISLLRYYPLCPPYHLEILHCITFAPSVLYIASCFTRNSYLLCLLLLWGITHYVHHLFSCY